MIMTMTMIANIHTRYTYTYTHGTHMHTRTVHTGLVPMQRCMDVQAKKRMRTNARDEVNVLCEVVWVERVLLQDMLL